MYTKVSIPKAGDGAGCAVAKDPTIILVDVEEISAEPSRDHGNVVMSGTLSLGTSGKAVGIYATPSTIEDANEYGGDVDARGLMQGFSFEHPGNSVELANFREHSLNRGFVALVKECNGTSGTYRYYGSKCNPLYVTPEVTNNKEANKTKFTLKQEQRGTFEPGIYSGNIPTLAEPADNEGSGSGEGA